VSKKLPGIRLIPVELEIGGKATAEGTKPLQQLLAARFARDAELPGAGDMDFNLIAFFEFESLDHNGGKTDGETVAPFGDLHPGLLLIYVDKNVYPKTAEVNKPAGILLRRITVLWPKGDSHAGNRADLLRGQRIRPHPLSELWLTRHHVVDRWSLHATAGGSRALAAALIDSFSEPGSSRYDDY
jgi:hypothetical protein